MKLTKSILEKTGRLPAAFGLNRSIRLFLSGNTQPAQIQTIGSFLSIMRNKSHIGMNLSSFKIRKIKVTSVVISMCGIEFKKPFVEIFAICSYEKQIGS